MFTRTIVWALAAWVCAGTAGAQTGGQPKVRVGVYDSRVVAIAYARSEFSPVKAKMAEYQAAKKAGNSAKMKELEAWGVSHQRLMHFMGFGHVPVGDLLEPVKAQLGEMAHKMRLTAIAMECDFTGPNVEVVDVTAEIAALYKPTVDIRKIMADLKRAKPLSLVELADMPVNE